MPVVGLQFLLKVAAVLLTVLMGVSACGLVVLMDLEDKKYAITNSQFGELWLKINRGNPVLQPFCFNFALIGLAMIYKQFYPTVYPQAPAQVEKKKK